MCIGRLVIVLPFIVMQLRVVNSFAKLIIAYIK